MIWRRGLRWRAIVCEVHNAPVGMSVMLAGRLRRRWFVQPQASQRNEQVLGLGFLGQWRNRGNVRFFQQAIHRDQTRRELFLLLLEVFHVLSRIRHGIMPVAVILLDHLRGSSCVSRKERSPEVAGTVAFFTALARLLTVTCPLLRSTSDTCFLRATSQRLAHFVQLLRVLLGRIPSHAMKVLHQYAELLCLLLSRIA